MERTCLSLWHGKLPCQISMAEIIGEVCAEFGVSEAALKSTNKTRFLCGARWQFMSRAYATGKFSLPQIGRFINRDHTTVLYGIRACSSEAM